MKIKNKKDFGLGVFCIVFALLIIYLSLQLKATAYKGDPGPKMFPIIGSVIMAICGIALIIAPEKQEKRFLTWAQWKAAFGLFGMYVGLALLLWLFGFMVAVPVALFIITLMLSKLSVKGGEVKEKRPIRSRFFQSVSRFFKQIHIRLCAFVRVLFPKLCAKDPTLDHRIVISIFYGIIGGAALYLAYVVGLKTQMPSGLLFELFG